MKQALSSLSPELDIQALTDAGLNYVAGVDEVGRGAWAGPMLIVSCTANREQLKRISKTREFPLINDSKILNKQQREDLFHVLQEFGTKNLLAFKLYWSNHSHISKYGLAYCLRKSVNDIYKNSGTDTHTIFDGGMVLKKNNFRTGSYRCETKADSRYFLVAAAANYAKILRDRLLTDFSVQYPGYFFEQNKGYGTKKHREAIAQLGICNLHRTSYLPLQNYLENARFS